MTTGTAADAAARASRPGPSTPARTPDPLTGAVVTPIHLASTYAQAAVGEHKGYDYCRTANPTRIALEAVSPHSRGPTTATPSRAAWPPRTPCSACCSPGDHLLIPNDAYGGTYRLVAAVYAPAGVATRRSTSRPRRARAAVCTDETRLVWVETPSNPLLTSSTSRPWPSSPTPTAPRCVVDNTFATPYLQQPLALGADAVVHSTTKYLGGHSDVVGGFVATRTTSSPTGSPSSRTRPGRCRARSTATWCSAGSRPSRCAWTATARTPRRSSSSWPRTRRSTTSTTRGCRPPRPRGRGPPDARLRRHGVVHRCAAARTAALAWPARTRLFTLAESLGAVESLIEHPQRMTHASVAGSPLAVDPALIRLSVGLETVEDLLRDLGQALEPFA